ncbi:MAG: RnfABCDGE type electron transport complex subunit G [Lachnospiraceae bacterium]|nr:RnfABCDGE type electron transport complex subunit G [Lachnospiraceae bacterium]
MSKQIKDALRLLVLTVVAGAALGVVYNVTKGPVAEAAQEKEQAAYKSVVPEAEKYEEIDNVDFNDANIATTMQPILADAPGVQSDITIDKVLVGVDGNQVVGTVVNVTSHDGYNGDISYSVGIDAEGKINKVEFLSISETPGLGMQAKTKLEHLEQYVGVASDNFTVVKDGSGNLKKDVADKTENIDSLSGSTITSKSVNNGINAAVVTAKTVYSTPGLKTVGGVPIG